MDVLTPCRFFSILVADVEPASKDDFLHHLSTTAPSVTMRDQISASPGGRSLNEKSNIPKARPSSQL